MPKKLDSDDQVGRLITLVKPYPILYNESVEGFEDKEKKELLWEDIGKKLGVNSRICRRKWVGLMLKYRKRENEGEAAVIDENGKVWPWYAKMQFVRYGNEDIKPEVVPTPTPEISNVVTSLETVDVVPEVKTESSSNVVRSNSVTNLNGNKLFLESLSEELSSLTLKDQYEFKRKVLDLMQFYVSKN
ncbi:hypothetical protein J437_LFUL002632 [Ladona fulva]|uniref:MADF domain-containing protein n=1 Tax=Ladona fulva TaxID=123851 RepID=A0A8K0NVP7_LADFU|nr:hypothetical protein J437_LFUL002632 [Ladona fulva]